MAFFIGLVNVIKKISLIIILIGISYVVTVFGYYSLGDKELKEGVVIIENEYIEILDTSNGDYINIDIKPRENVTKEYLVAYAYSYFDKYNKEIYLFVYDQEMILGIGRNNLAIFEKR